ncbi:MAG: hypothetical protein AAF363_01500 [Bacteroidota bacterium]
MKKLCFILISFSTYAQNENNINIIDFDVNPAGIIQETSEKRVDSGPKEFFMNEWSIGTITLKNGKKIRDVPIRFELIKSNVEIKFQDKIRVCPSRHFTEFTFLNAKNGNTSKFVNSTLYDDENPLPSSSIMEIIYEDSISLGALHYIEIKRATYIPAFDVGKESDEIIQKKTYYMFSKTEVIPLDKKLKKNLIHFSPYQEEIQDYAESKKLKVLNSEAEIMNLISFYNRLIVK